MRLQRACPVLIFCVSLAGCAGRTPLPLVAPPASQTGAAARAFTAHRDDLLYVSDIGTADVDVYSYPQGKPRGKLTGFVRPAGLCVDKAQNVYVTDLFASQIVEYRHGGHKPLQTLADPNEDPGDCSVDPTTGDLAVSNVSTPYDDPGNVVIFRHAKGKPHRFKDSAIDYYQFCGYDDRGNLYVDGTLHGSFQLAELRRGKHRFTNVSIDKKIRYAGAVQWDGRHVAVGDYEAKRIYQFDVVGAIGSEVGETRLKGSSFPIGFWIDGSRVIAPNDDGASVMFWSYPAGGTAIREIRKLDEPWGATISGSPRE